MIAYFPEILPDETMYSWFARYNAHVGYQGFVSVKKDLLTEHVSRINEEFWGKINGEVRKLLDKLYGMDYLLEKHTMFPQYARFAPKEKQDLARESIFQNTDDFLTILRFPKSYGRNMLYCPVCVGEDRENYGEAYWHREWLLRNIRTCSKHCCKLKDAGIPITSRATPSLFPAEEVLPESDYIEEQKELMIKLDRYVCQVFQQALPRSQQPEIVPFLVSRMEGTPYISATGKVTYIKKMLKDLMKYYEGLPNNRITEYYQLQQLLLGKNINFRETCQVALFLNISVDDLAHPVLPEKSQKERFRESVTRMHQRGLGSHRIAHVMKCSSYTVIKTFEEVLRQEYPPL